MTEKHVRCDDCGGRGLVLDGAGEPTECQSCGGDCFRALAQQNEALKDEAANLVTCEYALSAAEAELQRSLDHANDVKRLMSAMAMTRSGEYQKTVTRIDELKQAMDLLKYPGRKYRDASAIQRASELVIDAYELPFGDAWLENLADRIVALQATLAAMDADHG